MYRQNLTDEKNKKIKENDKIRKREKRANVQLTVDKLAIKRRMDREQQRKWREKAKLKPIKIKITMPFMPIKIIMPIKISMSF